MTAINPLQLARLVLDNPALRPHTVGLLLTSENPVQHVTLTSYPYNKSQVMCSFRLTDGRMDWFVFPRKTLGRTLQLLLCYDVEFDNDLT